MEAAAQKMSLPLDAPGMLGHRLYTDIVLGQTSGMTTVLMLSGETCPEDRGASPFKPDYVFEQPGAGADWPAAAG